jgi:hypothetical protein
MIYVKFVKQLINHKIQKLYVGYQQFKIVVVMWMVIILHVLYVFQVIKKLIPQNVEK